MKSTRSSGDPYATMKLPSSLLHQLRILAAKRNLFLYQLIAQLLVREIESGRERSSE
jgi:hypothetical protein